MRPEMLTKIHSSHLGTEACMRKAKDLVFWPRMYRDIKDITEKCVTCAEMSPAQQKLPLQSSSIPSRPWSKIAIDLFVHDNNDYMVTVDYYSDYFEIDRLRPSTTKEIIKALKPHFARHGVPDEVISDNAPNLVSDEFARFADKWEFRHITSSPYHSQSNGKAESAVKIAKKMMKKSKETKTDIFQALLDWRNTPTINMKSSPVQRLMSRRTKTGIPTSEKLLSPEVPKDVVEKISHKRRLAKEQYDKSAKELPELREGQPVYFKRRPMQDSSWTPGYCKPLTDRSIIVSTNDGEYRRNRIHVKERIVDGSNKVDTIHENVDMPMDVPEPEKLLIGENGETETDNGADANKEPPRRLSPAKEVPRSNVTRTRTRVIKKPLRLGYD